MGRRVVCQYVERSVTLPGTYSCVLSHTRRVTRVATTLALLISWCALRLVGIFLVPFPSVGWLTQIAQLAP